ncbi:MAG: hypothetical protein U0074_08455 [Kouleothrix sp.]
MSEKARLLDEQYIEQMLALATQVGDPRKRVLPPALQIQVHSLWGEVAGTKTFQLTGWCRHQYATDRDPHRAASSRRWRHRLRD